MCVSLLPANATATAGSILLRYDTRQRSLKRGRNREEESLSLMDCRRFSLDRKMFTIHFFLFGGDTRTKPIWAWIPLYILNFIIILFFVYFVEDHQTTSTKTTVTSTTTSRFISFFFSRWKTDPSWNWLLRVRLLLALCYYRGNNRTRREERLFFQTIRWGPPLKNQQLNGKHSWRIHTEHNT